MHRGDAAVLSRRPKEDRRRLLRERHPHGESASRHLRSGPASGVCDQACRGEDRLWRGVAAARPARARTACERLALVARHAEVEPRRGGAPRRSLAGLGPVARRGRRPGWRRSPGSSGQERPPCSHAGAASAASGPLAPTPWASGAVRRDQGIGRDGPGYPRPTRWRGAGCASSPTARSPDRERTAGGDQRSRRVMITALARKLLIALWRLPRPGWCRQAPGSPEPTPFQGRTRPELRS